MGQEHAHVEWAVVRPDTLLDGGVSGYTTHEHNDTSLFAPKQTTRANVAHFMAALATGDQPWAKYRGKFPTIFDDETPPAADEQGAAQ